MHGLKNDVILRSSKDPDMKIDWSMFNAVERLKIKKNSDGSIVDVRETYILEIFDVQLLSLPKVIHEHEKFENTC